MSKKKSKEIIKLVSTFSSHFYTKFKNKKLKSKKLDIKKFDPIIKKHVLYKECKL